MRKHAHKQHGSKKMRINLRIEQLTITTITMEKTTTTLSVQ